MPAIDLRAFIALEEALARTLTREWVSSLGDVPERLADLLSRKKWAEAYELIDTLSFDDIVASSEEQLEELAISCILFGASNAEGDLDQVVSIGPGRVPEQVMQSIRQLEISLRVSAAEQARAAYKSVVAAEEEAEHARLLKDESVLLKDSLSELADRINTATLAGKTMVDINANLVTSRLVSFGFLSEAAEAGIETYQVSEVMDSRTCEVCQAMHGRTFTTSYEYTKVMSALSTTDPKELSSLAPWPKNTKDGVAQLKAMSNADAQAAGYGSPPYHPLCRGVLVPAGTVADFVPTDLEDDQFATRYKRIYDVMPDVIEGEPPVDRLTFEELARSYENILNRGEPDALKHPTKVLMRLRSHGHVTSPALNDQDFAAFRGTNIYRGLSNPSFVAANMDRADFVGRGIFGDGQYYTVRSSLKVSLTDYGNFDSGGWTYTSKLSADARLIASDKIHVLRETTIERLQKLGLSEQAISTLASNDSAIALLNGYDGIRVAGNDYVVVLDKSRVVVREATLPTSPAARKFFAVSSTVDELAGLEARLSAVDTELSRMFSAFTDPVAAGFKDHSEILARAIELDKLKTTLMSQISALKASRSGAGRTIDEIIDFLSSVGE